MTSYVKEWQVSEEGQCTEAMTMRPLYVSSFMVAKMLSDMTESRPDESGGHKRGPAGPQQKKEVQWTRSSRMTGPLLAACKR